MTATSAACQACTAPTGDTVFLCRDCIQKLATDIASVTWMIRELETTLTRQARFVRQSDSGMARSATTPLPWDERAAQVTKLLDRRVHHWAIEVSLLNREDPRDPLSVQLQGSGGVVEVSRWLWRNLSTLRIHEQAGRAYDELRDVCQQAHETVDRPPDLVTYGMCGAELPNRVICHEYLYGAPNQLTLECRRCHTQFQLKERRDWMLAYVSNMMGTTGEIATYLTASGMGITPDAVRALIRRHPRDIPKRGDNAEGHALYRFSNVIDAVGNRYQRAPATVVAS